MYNLLIRLFSNDKIIEAKIIQIKEEIFRGICGEVRQKR